MNTPSAATLQLVQFMTEDGWRAYMLENIAAISGGGGGGSPTTELTPTSSLVTEDGSVAAGTRKVDMILSPDFAGTILGVAYAGGADIVVSFEAPGEHTLAAIAYTITAGNIRINRVA